jgi:FtsZ-binding cell division protein ZapB
MAKQAEDIKTLELPLDKRGRGRPAKADKLTQAERAKRYREKMKANGNKRDVSEKFDVETYSKLKLMESEVDAHKGFASQWFHEYKTAKKEIEQLRKENDLLVYERAAAWKEIERLKSLLK